MATEAVADNEWENKAMMYEIESVKVVDAPESWYSNLIFYLSIGDVPAGLDPRKRRMLYLKSARYQLVSGVLFQKKIDNILLRFLEKEESQKVLSGLHEQPTRGHFGVEVTVHKILKERYY